MTQGNGPEHSGDEPAVGDVEDRVRAGRSPLCSATSRSEADPTTIGRSSMQHAVLSQFRNVRRFGHRYARTFRRLGIALAAAMMLSAVPAVAAASPPPA